jgi:transcriptional regulator with XRE-family HTH domain
MKDRILKFLSLENLSPTRFADLLGVQRSGVSHILAERNKPSFDFIEKMLLAFPNLNAEWLLLGKGEVYKKADNTREPSLFKEVVSTKKEELKTTGSSVAGEKPTPIVAATPVKSGKMIEGIAILYADKSFCIYHQE